MKLSPMLGIAIMLASVIVNCGADIELSGRITYHRYNPTGTDSVALDYSQRQELPLRLAVINALDGSGQVVGRSITDMDGNYRIDVPGADDYVLAVQAKTETGSGEFIGSDQIGAPSFGSCQNPKWNVEVVASRTDRELYAVKRVVSVREGNRAGRAASEFDLLIPALFDGDQYVKDSAPPFAILDSIVEALEYICAAGLKPSFKDLQIVWARGSTGSFYQPVSGEADLINILGRENSDTDEYDQHVVVHEFGHFLERRFFRSDSMGGRHWIEDTLHPSIAFSEGWGNGFAALVLNDPIYRDTMGSNQESGFSFPINQPTDTIDGRNIYSEWAVMYFIYRMVKGLDYTVDENGSEQADPTGEANRFARLIGALGQQSERAGLMSLLGLAAGYHHSHGLEGDDLEVVWSHADHLAQPLDALCSGACTAGAETDFFDANNDLGQRYADEQFYPYGSTNEYSPGFWQLYRHIGPGTTTPTAHEHILGEVEDTTDLGSHSTYAYNKKGFFSHYTWRNDNDSSSAIDLNNTLVNGLSGCGTNVFSVEAFRGVNSILIKSISGCESFSLSGQGRFVLSLRGISSLSEVTNWSLTLETQKPQPPVLWSAEWMSNQDYPVAGAQSPFATVTITPTAYLPLAELYADGQKIRTISQVPAGRPLTVRVSPVRTNQKRIKLVLSVVRPGKIWNFPYSIAVPSENLVRNAGSTRQGTQHGKIQWHNNRPWMILPGEPGPLQSTEPEDE